LADFQLKMAMETENFQLDGELVRSAINYFVDSTEKEGGTQWGIWLVKLRGEKVIGTLFLTFENATSWWIESVYVIAE
jgi:hypothetical protein